MNSIPNVPHWYHRYVDINDVGPDVRAIRTMLNLAPEGPYDEGVAAMVRGVQRRASIVTDGVVGPHTARVLGEPPTYGMIPTWWQGRELQYGMSGDDVYQLSLRIFVPDRLFGSGMEGATRRWETSRGYAPTGVFTEAYAIELGD